MSRTNCIFEKLFTDYPKLSPCKDDVYKAFECIKNTYLKSGKLLTCGNGGSAADCQHTVGELMKGFMLKRPLTEKEKEVFKSFGGEKIADNLQGALPAVSLVGENALFTAFCNDCNPEYVFAQQVYGLMNKDDVLLCFSTSGNSFNVVNASLTAKVKGGKTVAITGKDGGKLKEICDVTVVLPSDSTPEIQEMTLPVYHALCAMLESEFFES